MTPRWRVSLIVALSLAVLVAGIYLPILRQHMRRATRLQQQSEEQARRQLAQPTVANTRDPLVKATLFWASSTEEGSLTPVSIELPLSDDPVIRCRQVLNTLLAGPVDTELRTLPPDAVLLAFYLMSDGTAVADFSEAMATSIPSGIESEQMAADSITKTLQANVPQVRKLKILIHGQEVETLAGHLDLSGTFLVNANPEPMPRTPSASASAAGAPVAPDKLTPATAPGKLTQSASKP